MSYHHRYKLRDFCFAQRLLTLRKRTGLTQQEVALRVGVAEKSIRNWEGGIYYPTELNLQKLTELYLDENGFAAGQEREEAGALWKQLQGSALHHISNFDELWIASLLKEWRARRYRDPQCSSCLLQGDWRTGDLDRPAGPGACAAAGRSGLTRWPASAVRQRALFPLMVISYVIGVPEEHNPAFRAWSREITAHLPRDVTHLESFHQFQFYLKQMINERRAMLHPPDDLITRLMQTELEGSQLSNDEIAASKRMIIELTSANRDEATWNNPDAFLLDRPNVHRHLAFGYGIHFCLGAELARLEARIVLEMLLNQFPTLRLALDFHYEPMAAEIMWGPKQLPVTW